MSILNQLDQVILQAQIILSESGNVDGEKILEQTETYLMSLESWQDDYKSFLAQEESLSESEKISLKSKLETLELSHSSIMQKASSLLDVVKDEIGKVNKSSTAIKKYINNPVVNTRPTIRKG